jgi:NodT family efflux transporter outer membrane factor (OMF) lipoprotein
MTSARPLLSAVLIPATMLSACSFAPHYQRPATVSIPASFKEAPGWKAATPSDAVARGAWWTLFNDPTLDTLERKVIVSNQTLAADQAAYDQARALVREDRAALFPTVSLQTNTSDAGAFGGASGIGFGNGGHSTATTNSAYQAGVEATWEPDIWGSIRNTVSQAKSQAQASQATLINATLSAQGQVALDYIQLRGYEAQKVALDATVVAYQRALTITNNLYHAGVDEQSDVLSAEGALDTARGSAAALIIQRQTMEHAIALLVGENPSTFTIAPATTWSRAVPDVPSILPSQLLERRPDVAMAERTVAAANAGIGIAKAAFFPTIGLTAQAGQSASSLGSLFSLASSAWSTGLSGALTLLDFGALRAKEAQAKSLYTQTVAEYRTAVLTAIQQTEDELVSVRIYKTVSEQDAAAAIADDRAEKIAENQYVAGEVAYSTVLLAQETAMAARTADIQAVVNRQSAAVSLIEAIGGRWTDPAPLNSK